MEANSAHFSISARFYQPGSRKEFAKYTLHLAERLHGQAPARDHHNVESLPQLRMQLSQRGQQPSLAAIANNSYADALSSYHAITIIREFVSAYADGHCRMSMHAATAPHSGEIGGPAQPQGGFHELASVPIHLFDVVRGHCQLMTAPAAPSLYHVPAAARAHPLAKAVYAFPPANLGLPGALG